MLVPSSRKLRGRNFSMFGLFVIPLCLLSGCGGTAVEAVNPTRGMIVESFTEQARTRLEKKYPITMPVSGRIYRIHLEPGDPVKKGQELVQFDRVPLQEAVKRGKAAVAELRSQIVVNEYNEIEMTALVEAKAAIKAMADTIKAVDAQVDAEKARTERAQKHFRRMTSLIAQGAIPQSKMDDATLESETTLIGLKRQEFYRAAMNAIMVIMKLGPDFIDKYLGRKKLQRNVLEQQLDQERAGLATASHDLELAHITAPIDGVVLERYELGDSTLPAGRQLLLLGNLDDLEVVANVLTEDALKVKPGTSVRLEPATGSKPIRGRVKRIDPAGFTKRSSLGVEQQRVKVIISFTGGHEGLKVAYRLQARFLTGHKPNALIVPRFSVIQAPDGKFYVFTIKNGRIKKQRVKIGLRNDLHMEVTSGLTEEDVIVAKPVTSLKEGTRVHPVIHEGSEN